MQWPERIIVVDDLAPARHVAELMQDLSWIVKTETLEQLFSGARGDVFKIERSKTKQQIREELANIPAPIRELAMLLDGKYFLSKAHGVVVQTDSDVTTALGLLKGTEPALAFIDFDYSKSQSDAQALLSQHYEELPDDPEPGQTDWKIATSSEYGGLVFCATYKPQLEPTLRLLCPASIMPPRAVEQMPFAMPKCDLRGGVDGWIRAIIAALTRWVELQNESLPKLASELMRAQFGKRDDTGRRRLEMPEVAHPLNPADVPNDILLSSQFKADLESYKALYYLATNDLADEVNRKGGIQQAYDDFDRRLISVSLFAELLRRFNIHLSADLDDDAKIQFPIAPGALFVICLVDFLNNASIKEVCLSHNTWQGRAGVELRMEIADTVRFESAVMTGSGGSSIAAFRRLLACKKDRFKELIAIETSEAEKNQIEAWLPQSLPLGEGHSPVWWAILKWRVESATLIVWWPSATGGREPW